jgi:hypothetical protein
MRFPCRRTVLIVLAGACVITLALVYKPVARSCTSSFGEHLTLAQATVRDVHLALPSQAEDIRFYQHFQPDQSVKVDFAISEDDFLNWAEQQGWKPVPIVGSITVWPRSRFGDHETEIRIIDGYVYNTLRRGTPNTFSVVYDRQSGRAYYNFQSEPLGED